MKSIIVLFKNRLFIQLVGVIALCGLIWFAGPMIGFGSRVPLDSQFNRLLAIFCVFVTWTGYNLVRQAVAGQKERLLEGELAKDKVSLDRAALDDARKAELQTLRRKFEEALRLLRKTQPRGKRGKRYLYQLPWFVIIGAPGSGKTTLLLNSELEFPLAERFGDSVIQGVGGTRNCDWFFANEAIFLDTAGRYTTHDSQQPLDEAAWRGFLKLIKKHRPRRPINGILIAMSMSDLLQKNNEEIHKHAKEIRKRIMELHSVLRAKFPIYMLFTKCDLVAGFTDFFMDLNQEERTQVWGETFPGQDAKQTHRHVEGFHACFTNLLKRLNQRTLRRIQDERSIERRGLIMDFPQQMTLVKPTIMSFLQNVFGVSRYEAEPLLRGVYFTSSTQGGTPIDRIMGLMAAAYGMDRGSTPKFSTRGRSYFITRLLREVIIPEAELARLDSGVQRRRRWVQWSAYASIFVLTASMLAVWSFSYIKNRQAIAKVQNYIDEYRNVRRDSKGLDGVFRDLLPRLNLTQVAYDIYKDRSPWMGLGLYQGDKLQDAILRIYEEELQKGLLPAIQWSIEERMNERLRVNPESEMEALYEQLKIYLMLGMPKRFDPVQVKAWISRHWERAYPREPDIRAQLMAHTQNLFGSKFAFEPISMDLTLIANVRQRLNAVPLGLQIYAHLRSKALLNHSYDLKLAEALPPHSDEIFATADGQQVQAVVIPGLYTCQGYDSFFRRQGLDLIKQALEENWVLDNQYASQPDDTRRLYDDILKLYFADYERLWVKLVNNISVKKPQNIESTIKTIDRLCGPESPLRALLTTVEKNVCLMCLNQASAESETGAQVSETVIRSGHGGALPEQAIQMASRFKDLNRLIQSSGGTPPPLEDTLKSLGEVRDFLMRAAGEGKALSPAGQGTIDPGMKAVFEKAKLQTTHLPDPVKGLLTTVVDSGRRQTNSNTRSELNDLWRTDVLAIYKAGLQGRYPLFRDSPNSATIQDFTRFFGPGGLVDHFFQERLRPLVDTSGSAWHPLPGSQAVNISSLTLRQLQNAARIREAFFAAGGQTPSAQFELKPVYLDAAVTAFSLNIEGQATEYRHGPTLSARFQWPGPQTNAGVRMVFHLSDGQELSQSEEGPWAFMKMLDKGVVETTDIQDRMKVTFQLGGYRAQYELRTGSVFNPFNLSELQQFRCPESL